ncbi:ATP synthase F0 subunit 6 (mitochondrion) [Mytilus trossulus]|uniref:ATP synthase subunit a n=1 Tax=Mytilus trossulus TaxID=6551 RepID=Q2VTF4_MYTTR|nr:ATP synthase F0 subunit 6 [Mytilus trossulus]AAV68436.1 ATP synthase F0 subunit 6 [Mytilus trossulus]ADJ80425.1 ATP synthase F0 subunit 6 [Mytilus trossulus]
MLMDVFSSFDAHSYNLIWLSMPLWLLSSMVPMTVLFSDVYTKGSSTSSFRSLVLSFTYSMIRLNGKGLKLSGFPLVMSGLFMMILMLNLSGNFPFFFPVSGQFVFGFSFALSIWTCLVLSSLLCSFEQGLMSLVPTGCPLILVPFMVVVELISGMLRPLTLVLRLTLNLGAGKVILTMCSSELVVSWLNSSSLLTGVGGIKGLMMGGGVFGAAEVAIACIQCYIFCVLLCLYTEDHSS